MGLAGFGPAIPPIERLQTYAIDRTATWIGGTYVILVSFKMKIAKAVDNN
jgi:hypothetical protein